MIEKFSPISPISPMKKDSVPRTLVEEKLSLDIKAESKNKELEVENKELKEKLENIKKLFYTIAHELKTPVGNTTTLIGFLSEDIGSLINEEIIDHLDIICKNNEFASKLLEDLLIWSKLQLDGIKLEILVMNLTEEVKNSVAPLLLAIEQKKIKFENKIPDNVDILADSFMIQTVIRNLISNAIKFTSSGGNISISCEKKNNSLEIYVKDDGVGLSEKQKKNLLENIGVSTPGTNEEKGTGLGFSICKDMVKKMGGTIRVESEGEGKGTTVIVTLPEGRKE